MSLGKTFILLSLLMLSLNGFNQKTYYFEVSGSLTNDVFENTDPLSNIGVTSSLWGSWGITAGRKLNQVFQVETGIFKKDYWVGFGYYENHKFINSHFSNSIESVQIPFRFVSKYDIFDERVYFTSTLGLRICTNLFWDHHHNGSSWNMGGLSTIKENYNIEVSYTADGNVNNIFVLSDSGFGLEVRIHKNSFLTFSASYLNGFMRVIQLDIDYKTKDVDNGKAYAHSNGDYWNFGLGFRHYFDGKK